MSTTQEVPYTASTDKTTTLVTYRMATKHVEKHRIIMQSYLSGRDEASILLVKNATDFDKSAFATPAEWTELLKR